MLNGHEVMPELPQTLEDLVIDEEPHATFHDASVRVVVVDYLKGTCVVECELVVGNPEAATKDLRERTRLGRLCFSGLLFWVFEAPGNVPMQPGGALWLTSDGPLGEVSTAIGRNLALSAPLDVVRWYFYFSNVNAFAYVAAANLAFEWMPDT